MSKIIREKLFEIISQTFREIYFRIIFTQIFLKYSAENIFVLASLGTKNVKLIDISRKSESHQFLFK